MIGQFHFPVTGEAVVNDAVRQILVADGHKVRCCNTSVLKEADDVGRFSFRKAVKSLWIIGKCLFFIPWYRIVYITPGQTNMGALRFTPIVLWTRLWCVQVICHWHGYGFLGVFRKHGFLAKAFLGKRVRHVFLTEDMKRRAVRQDFCPVKMDVVYNFYENFCGEPSKKSAATVLYLGSLMKEKGIYTFIEAAQTLKSLDFVVCGSGSEILGEQLSVLSDERVLDYRGRVSGREKSNALAEAGIFVLQTHYRTEGVPLALLEAMASGCAIITTAHNGIPEVVGDAGMYVEPNSLKSLVEALQTLQSDKDLLRTLQMKSLERSKAFTMDAFSRSIRALFAEY